MLRQSDRQTDRQTDRQLLFVSMMIIKAMQLMAMGSCINTKPTNKIDIIYIN